MLYDSAVISRRYCTDRMTLQVFSSFRLIITQIRNQYCLIVSKSHFTLVIYHNRNLPDCWLPWNLPTPCLGTGQCPSTELPLVQMGHLLLLKSKPGCPLETSPTEGWEEVWHIPEMVPVLLETDCSPVWQENLPEETNNQGTLVLRISSVLERWCWWHSYSSSSYYRSIKNTAHAINA